MQWLPWTVGVIAAVVFLGAVFVVVGATAARAWSGEAVGAMRVRKWYAYGSHDRLRVAVRRSIHGKAVFRDVHVLVGSALMPAAIVLSQVDAVHCAELLERAAGEADSRP
jgi:hypothetical protein